MQSLDFLHQRFVNRQAASGVDQQHVDVMFAGIVQRGQHDVHRLLTRVAGEPFGASLGRHRLQLLNGGGAVHVSRHRQDFFLALGDQVLGEFGGGGGLASALQTRHQDDSRRLGGQVDVRNALAHGGGQLFLHDADQDLAGRERVDDFLAQGFVFHAGDEIAHHRQCHVGFEQSHADFAQHVGHIRFGDAGLATDLLDQLGEFVAEGGCHGFPEGLDVARNRRQLLVQDAKLTA